MSECMRRAGKPTISRAAPGQANLAAIFTPGPQVDDSVTTGPWLDDPNRLTDLRAPAFVVDYNVTADGGGGGGAGQGRNISITQSGDWQWAMAAAAPCVSTTRAIYTCLYFLLRLFIVAGYDIFGCCVDCYSLPRHEAVVTGTGNYPAITIRVGDTITFKGRVESSHNFAVKGPGSDQNTQQRITQNADPSASPTDFSVTWAPTEVGSYTYYCVPHASIMKGVITVEQKQGGAAFNWPPLPSVKV